MAALAKSHTTLRAEHKALKEDYTALKKSYSDKEKAIKPIIESLPYDPNNCQLAQIYTIMADASTLSIHQSVTLVLSESNKKLGHHHIAVNQGGILPELKFRLEWKKEGPVDASNSKERYSLRFFHVSGTPCKGTAFDVLMNRQRRVARICCGKFRDVPNLQGANSLEQQLVGELSLECRQQKNEPLTIYINEHDRNTRLRWFRDCGCDCHPPQRHKWARPLI